MSRFRELVEDISKATTGEELDVALVAPLLAEMDDIYNVTLAERDLAREERDTANEANKKLQESNHTLLMQVTERDLSKDEEEIEDEEEFDVDEILDDLYEEWD